MVNYNVWFTADLHLSHKNILKHQKQRCEHMSLISDDDILNHDRYIIDMWQRMTKRNDHIYVLGDFILDNYENSMNILNQLKNNGCKIHLIVGNHDKQTAKMNNMFESIDLIKKVVFKKDNFPFLCEDFEVVMCHYPMKTWDNKCRGSMQLYGHVHSNSLWIDEDDDLCLNVGIDNPFCDYQLLSLENIYCYYLSKLNGLLPKDYADKISQFNKKFIR